MNFNSPEFLPLTYSINETIPLAHMYAHYVQTGAHNVRDPCGVRFWNYLEIYKAYIPQAG